MSKIIYNPFEVDLKSKINQSSYFRITIDNFTSEEYESIEFYLNTNEMEFNVNPNNLRSKDLRNVKFFWNSCGDFIPSRPETKQKSEPLQFLPFLKKGSGVSGEILKWDTWLADANCTYFENNEIKFSIDEKIFFQAKKNNPQNKRNDWRIFLEKDIRSSFFHFILSVSMNGNKLDKEDVYILIKSFVSSIFKDIHDKVKFLLELTQLDFNGNFNSVSKKFASFKIWMDTINGLIQELYIALKHNDNSFINHEEGEKQISYAISPGKSKSKSNRTKPPSPEEIEKVNILEYLRIAQRKLENDPHSLFKSIFDSNLNLINPLQPTILAKFFLLNKDHLNLKDVRQVWCACIYFLPISATTTEKQNIYQYIYKLKKLFKIEF